MVDSALKKVLRILKEDIELRVNINSIQIGHTLSSSWDTSREVLLNPDQEHPNLEFSQTDLLEPTNLDIHFINTELYKLKVLKQVDINLRPIQLSIDYKDISFLYLLSLKVTTITGKVNQENIVKNVKEKMADQVGKAIEQVSKEIESKEGNQIIWGDTEFLVSNELDPAYLESINYQFGEKILKFDPHKFRKETMSVSITLAELKCEFCDLQLTNHSDLLSGARLPLI